MTNNPYNEIYSQAYTRYKVIFEDLENWYYHNKFAKIVLLSEYLDTDKVKTRHNSRYIKEIKNLYKVIIESFDALVKPSQYKQVLLNKLQECAKLDFTDKSTLSYNIFSCQYIKNGSDIIIKSYNSSIEKFNYAAKSIINSGIETMRDQYKIVIENLKILTEVFDQETYDESKAQLEIYNGLVKASGSKAIDAALSKSASEYLNKCQIYKKLFEFVAEHKSNEEEMTKCFNLQFDSHKNVFFQLNKCKDMLAIYDNQYVVIKNMAKEYNQVEEVDSKPEYQLSYVIFEAVSYMILSYAMELITANVGLVADIIIAPID